MKKTKKIFSLIMAVAIFVSAFSTGAVFAEESADVSESVNTENVSMYSWDLKLLNEGAYNSYFKPFFDELNIDRVYQEFPIAYMTRQEGADFVDRLQNDGIEVVALIGDRAWGLADNDLNEYKAYVDALCDYNNGLGKTCPITRIGLDIETYTYSDWKENTQQYFEAYNLKMKEAYDYAKEKGFDIIQIVPVHYDAFSTELTDYLFTECADEISLMNYEKAHQVDVIEYEVELCRKNNIPVETIFETMPLNDYFSVTQEVTYFYDGFEPLKEKRDAILSTYNYKMLTSSYHYLTTIYPMIKGEYFAEIYAYTSDSDPNIDDLGQTDALPSITLTGDDGSVIRAYLYNPNIGAEYEECCYLAVGVKPNVSYTITSDSEDYVVSSKAVQTFELSDQNLTDYTSVGLRYVGCKHNEGTTLTDVKAATCTENGYTGDEVCNICNAVITKGTTISATGHTDDDSDGLCDCCGGAIKNEQKPGTHKECRCLCHEDGLINFFFRVANLFLKFFRLNTVCRCGAEH